MRSSPVLAQGPNVLAQPTLASVLVCSTLIKCLAVYENWYKYLSHPVSLGATNPSSIASIAQSSHFHFILRQLPGGIFLCLDLFLRPWIVSYHFSRRHPQITPMTLRDIPDIPPDPRRVTGSSPQTYAPLAG
jgi:hypothetical protein